MSTESKVGRPSKYKPEYCSMLVEHMKTGLSFESFAAVIAVNQDTLHEWAKVHSAFSEAKKDAYALNLLFWEQHGIDGLYNKSTFDRESGISETRSLNSTVWIFNMKNRHKWRDKQPDETDVIVNNNNVTTMSDAELDAKLAKLKGEK